MSYFLSELAVCSFLLSLLGASAEGCVHVHVCDRDASVEMHKGTGGR